MNHSDPQPEACLSDFELTRLLGEESNSPENSSFIKRSELHLEICESCQVRLSDRAGEVELSDLAEFSENGFAGTTRSNSLSSVIEDLKSKGRNADSLAAAASLDRSAPDLSFLEPCDDTRYLGRFSDYLIQSMIGYGGMGIVFRAFEPSLERTVAVKVLAPRSWNQPSARTRFVREARYAAAIEHENIVPIYRVDEHQGIPFFTMQFVDGPSLQEVIDVDGPLDANELSQLARQLASGLSAAHALDVIHRDIKPANILRSSQSGNFKITDFGLAHQQEDLSLTTSGAIVGTPNFMSPEQAGGQPVDHRSDLFSLGSVLYFASTGRSPFAGDDLFAVIRKVSSEAPAKIQRDDLPQRYEKVVERLLGKSPDARFQSAADLSLALDQVTLDEPVAELQPTRQSIFSSTSLVGLVVAAIALPLIAYIVFAAVSGLPNAQTAAGNQANDSGQQTDVDSPVRPAGCYLNGDSHGTLEAAVQASQSGDMIELVSAGAISLDEAIVIGHDLTIVGVGSEKQKIGSVGHSIFFLQTGSLRLENLSLAAEALGPFELPSRPDQYLPVSLIAMTEGKLELDNCQLKSAAIAIGVESADSVRLGNSIIESNSAAIALRQTHQLEMIEFESCRVAAPVGINIMTSEMSRAIVPSKVVIRNSIFRCQHLIEVCMFGARNEGFKRHPNFTVAAYNNLFQAEVLVRPERFAKSKGKIGSNMTPRGVKNVFHWSGTENAFSKLDNFVRSVNKTNRVDILDSLESWLEFNSNPNSNSRELQIEFESGVGTQTQFDILAPIEFEKDFAARKKRVTTKTSK